MLVLDMRGRGAGGARRGRGVGVIPDAFITDLRAKVVRELPWPIPATVLLQMRDEDLDHLAAASDEDYWRVLNALVTRIESRAGPPFLGG
jgi:hypothetical protein